MVIETHNVDRDKLSVAAKCVVVVTRIGGLDKFEKSIQIH